MLATSDLKKKLTQLSDTDLQAIINSPTENNLIKTYAAGALKIKNDTGRIK